MTKKKISTEEAIKTLTEKGIDLRSDFHTLAGSQVDLLISVMQSHTYRAPPADRRNGSAARYFFPLSRKMTA